MESPKRWHKLDNAAKYFPPTSSRKHTGVFRVVCELYETVDPALLQRALEQTVALLPYFRTVLKRGAFWYYLEESEEPATVLPESLPPCAPIYPGNAGGLLFRASFYKTRINLDIFHALADGTGALQFLALWVMNYLFLKHPGLPPCRAGADGASASIEKRFEDSFGRNYQKKHRRRGVHGERAYQLKQPRLPDGELSFIVGHMPVADVLKLARAENASLSEYLVALLIVSVCKTMPPQKQGRPVTINIPVDLRKYYGSVTMRNFFNTMNLAYGFEGGPANFAAVLAAVQQGFKEQLEPEHVAQKMNQFSALEHNPLMRVIPLAVKDLALRMADLVSRQGDTAAFSNLGAIQLPQAYAPHVRLFDCMISTPRPQICLCSYGGVLSVSFSSPLAGAEVQRNFFTALAAGGIRIEIAANAPLKGDGHAVL